jgi:hypothetical protein
VDVSCERLVARVAVGLLAEAALTVVVRVLGSLMGKPSSAP